MSAVISSTERWGLVVITAVDTGGNLAGGETSIDKKSRGGVGGEGGTGGEDNGGSSKEGSDGGSEEIGDVQKRLKDGNGTHLCLKGHKDSEAMPCPLKQRSMGLFPHNSNRELVVACC